MGELVKRGSKYSDQQRREAVLEYSVCGSLTKASESTGVSRRTLADWLKSEWWGQLTAELHQGDSELVQTVGEGGEVVETKVGRPTAYKPEYAEQAMRLCLLGAVDSELGDFFGVSEQTINAWKGRYPDFLESLRRGKTEADSRVAERLYARAIGYEHEEEKLWNHQGQVIRAETTKHYPPDTMAAALWLKNRRSQDWRDTKHIEVAKNERETLTIVLAGEAGRSLATKLGEAGVEVIEGECEQIEKDTR